MDKLTEDLQTYGKGADGLGGIHPSMTECLAPAGDITKLTCTLPISVSLSVT